jgi:general secretion pathway protein M
MNPRDWYDSLSTRERNLVTIAGGLLAIALIYLIVVLPLQTLTDRKAKSVQRKTADLAWMQGVAPQVMQAYAPGGAGSGESLVVLVDRTAREAGLGSALGGQSPDGEQGLRLRLESAPFDAVVTWLALLQEQHGVTISAANIDAASAPGLVNASLTLSNGSAGAK